MKRTDFIVVALRLLAVYLLVMGGSQLPASIASLYSTLNALGSESQAMTVSLSLLGITYFIACAIVWTMAPRIAQMIEGDLPKFEAVENEFTMSTALTVGLVILGFFVLSESIPALVNILFAVLLPKFDTNYAQILSPMGERISIIPWSNIASVATEIAIGICLIFGSKGIVVFLKKVRYAGREAI